MAYRIKSVGIDVGSVNCGAFALELNTEGWKLRALDAIAVKVQPENDNISKFQRHYYVAEKILEFVKKYKPDIVGIEDYTNQSSSHVAFSIAELNGIIRTLNRTNGYRQVTLKPHYLTTMFAPQGVKIDPGVTATGKKKPKSPILKKLALQFVEKLYNTQFQGDAKEQSDMADAAIYGYIAACFFAAHWLGSLPPMTAKQRTIFHSIMPSPSSKAFESYRPYGLLDIPNFYLIRNPEKEAEIYTPEWLKAVKNNG
jgi:Holliday junction resolvasome RuvABC endonuclease subunit